MKKTISLIAILLYSFCMVAQDERGSILKEKDSMPEFELASTIYGNISSKNLKGKVVLINIFATWCLPCQTELAAVEKTLWPQYKDNSDFVMLVVGREHTDEELQKYNQKKKFTFPLYPDPKRDFTALFSTKTIPRTYLIDKEGKIIYTSIGYTDKDFNNLMKRIEEELK